VTNILAITPESASSILVIGRAKDLGLCGAVKRDGKVCKSWCDRRVSDVCEWHVQYAVEQRRANRPEFSAGYVPSFPDFPLIYLWHRSTSGMSMNARKRKPDFDPRRKWGLKPLDESSGATYIVSGHIIGGGARDSMYISESMGREGQAKASRKLAAREDARVLKALQERDTAGMKAVMKAREVGLAEKEEQRASKGSEKGKKKASAADAPAATPGASGAKAAAFSAQVLKQLGFDPTLKPGQRRPEGSAIAKKVGIPTCSLYISLIVLSALLPARGPGPSPILKEDEDDKTWTKTRGKSSLGRHSPKAETEA
jgi:minichromosome maintenance protein 10